MIINENVANSAIGGFVENSDSGFSSMLSRLDEAMSSQFQLNYAKDIVNILEHTNSTEAYKDIILEDYSSYAPSQDMYNVHKRNIVKFEQLMENSRNALLEESLSSSLNPVVGLTFPLLKRYWVNCIYKDVLPTEVATAPVTKIGIETQYIEDENGKRYNLPEAFDHNFADIMGIVRKKLPDTLITVPSLDHDLITAAGGSVKQEDAISRDFYISRVFIEVPSDRTEAASTGKEIVEIPVRIDVEPADGTFGRNITAKGLGAHSEEVVKDYLSGQLDFETGLLTVGSVKAKITGIKVHGSLSSENHLRTASTGWTKDIKQFVIADGDHLATGLTEERIKDEKIVYNIDTTAKAISQMTDTIVQLKDIKIRNFLDTSRDRIKGTKYYSRGVFDVLPPTTYERTPTEWRKIELKETLDRLAISLKYILKNKSCYFAVIGNPMDIKLVDEVNWVYGQDAEVGGIKLDYSLGIYNDQHRFFVVSSERAELGKIKVLLIPTTEEHITYKHFEYQFFISNRYNRGRNVRTPSVMVSDRSLTDEVIPIQGEIIVVNSGKIGTSELYKSYDEV